MTFNKFISAVVAVSLSANLLFPVPSFAEDSDYTITLGDLKLMQSYLSGEKTISKEQYQKFDLNGDSDADVFDFILMKQSFKENNMPLGYSHTTELLRYSYTENMDYTENTAVIHSQKEFSDYLAPLFNSDIIQIYINKYNSKFFDNNILIVNSFLTPYSENSEIDVPSVNYYDDSINITADFSNAKLSEISAAFIQVIIPKSDYIDTHAVWNILGRHETPVENKKLIDVENILQNPELPTGCEVTALTILLNHLGYPVDKVTMARNYLPKLDFYWENGIYYGADFRTTFAGNPESEYSYGCYAPCIATTADNYFADNGLDATAYDITGADFDSLLSDYIDNDMPVLIWITSSNLHESSLTSIWTTPDGEQVQWRAYEHCAVLTGYDLDNQLIYVSDSLYGNVEYDYDTIRQRYIELGQQALYIQ